MESIPPQTRLIALAVGIAALIALLLNHWLLTTQNSTNLAILCIGPLAVLLGFGGAIEPKVVWSMGKFGQHLPVKYKLIGGLLGFAGVAVTFILVFVVYRFDRG